MILALVCGGSIVLLLYLRLRSMWIAMASSMLSDGGRHEKTELHTQG
jgi:hypothetical protein